MPEKSPHRHCSCCAASVGAAVKVCLTKLGDFFGDDCGKCRKFGVNGVPYCVVGYVVVVMAIDVA